MKKKNFIKMLNCPICFSREILNKGYISSKLEEINNFFILKKCTNCNHRFLSLFPKISFLNKLYKKNSRYVFGHDENEESQKNKFKKKGFKNVKPYNEHWIFDYINMNEKSEYLEIGPGLCRMYKTFYKKNWSCNGIDLQPFIKVPGIVKNIKKIKNNIKDVAVAFDVIEHTSEPIKFLKDINKKMKKGGKLFLTFPNSDSFKSRLLNNRWNMVVPLAHINFFSKKSSAIALKKAGFKMLHIKNFSLVTPRRLIRNFFKLPFKLILDFLKLDINKIYFRLNEFFINILDLFNGDQMLVIAKKKSN